MRNFGDWKDFIEITSYRCVLLMKTGRHKEQLSTLLPKFLYLGLVKGVGASSLLRLKVTEDRTYNKELKFITEYCLAITKRKVKICHLP